MLRAACCVLLKTQIELDCSTTGNPLNILDDDHFFVLQENKASLPCLFGSGLKAIFHCLANRLIFLKSWLSSPADILRSLTIEYNIVSSAKKLNLDLIYFSKSLM